jgi:hypothetical protein
MKPPPRWLYWGLITADFAAIQYVDDRNGMVLFALMVFTVLIAPLK